MGPQDCALKHHLKIQVVRRIAEPPQHHGICKLAQLRITGATEGDSTAVVLIQCQRFRTRYRCMRAG